MNDSRFHTTLDFDRGSGRLTGIVSHGMTPYDVPHVSHIVGHLWTGGSAMTPPLPDDIVHVVSLYPWEQFQHHRNVRSSVVRVMHDDNGPVDADTVYELAEHVLGCLADGPTLVACWAGLNRSALVAATALMLDGFTADEAIRLLRERRSPAVLCNQTFERWLRAHDDN